MLHHHLQRRLLLTLILLILIFFIATPPQMFYSQFYYFFHPKEGIQCYHNKKTPTLPDIAQHPPPTDRRSIFFHETSCSSHFHGKIVIRARQACAVESAARLNPNMRIHLLYAAPGRMHFTGTQSDRILQALLTYDNLKILHVDYEHYTKDTPVEELYRKGAIEGSGYAQSHASDVLRYITLWKYGGIYLDLDVVVTKSLESLPENFAGSESDRNVAAGVLSFSPTGQGHKWAWQCLNDLKDNFKGYDWGNNGPGVITRLLRQTCNVHDAKDMQSNNCAGFIVYPPRIFYPIPWWNWTMYFDAAHTDAVLKLAEDSYVIHVWNKHSIRNRIPVGEVPLPAYAHFAQQFCPKVFGECHEYF